MKRPAVLISVLIFLFVSGAASNGNAGKGIKWELKNGTLTISGNGSMKDFGKDLPWNPLYVERLVVEEGVTHIGSNLCRGSKNLVSVTLPSTLKLIGDNAFHSCVMLPDIYFPFGLESIGNRAFFNCKSFLEIDVPVSLKHIGFEAFAKCTSITTFGFTQGIDCIGDGAFDGCLSLTNLSGLPDYINIDNSVKFGLNRIAVKNHMDRKEEMATRFGASDNLDNKTKNSLKKFEPSDIDNDVPFTGIDNLNTFALIIANENYGKLANVPYAINDGNSFAIYCRRTLGIPERNIFFYKDASYGVMREAFGDLRLINDVVGEDMKVIVYYAGHGAPDDATLEPYLIPVDAGKVSKTICLPLAYIYQELGAMQLSSAIVFLDACFSGETRDGKMVVADARSIARVPKKQGLTGKVAVLSATSDTQTAMPYHEKGHGMFTYYLLKRLQETKGNTTLADLKDYVVKEVSINSTIINRKNQTPTFSVSNEASSIWDAWKLAE